MLHIAESLGSGSGAADTGVATPGMSSTHRRAVLFDLAEGPLPPRVRGDAALDDPARGDMRKKTIRARRGIVAALNATWEDSGQWQLRLKREPAGRSWSISSC